MSLLQQIQDAAEDINSDMAIPPVTDKEELIGRIAESVTAKDGRTLQAYILEQRLPDPHQFWELITLLAPCLTSENLEERPQFFTTVRRSLNHFSRHGNPKEMVLAFLEQMEGFQDDALFITLLPCLQNALLQLPVKRGRSLELALDTLSCHITAIPSPENWNLEGEETKLLETDERICRFLNVLPPYLDFMQPFLVGGSSEGDGGGRCWELKILKKHLLQLLQHPLVFLDLRHSSKDNSPKSYSREIAETVVHGLVHVENNFFRLLLQNTSDKKTVQHGSKNREESPTSADVEDTDMDAENMENERRAAGAGDGGVGETVEDEFSELSGACLAYLVQVEWLGQNRWPVVHSSTHLLHANLAYTRVLLTHPAHTAVHKGLALLSFRLDLIQDFELSADFLDDENTMPVIKALITVMIYCPIRELRVSGLSVFKTVFAKLQCAGRHQLMKSVLASCEHAGVKGVVAGLLKNEIDTAVKSLEMNDNDNDGAYNAAETFQATEALKLNTVRNRRQVCEYFLNSKLEQLLRLATKLPEGAASDLLEQSDLIMAVLNLLRYMVLRDPRHANLTGLWDMTGWLEKDYLSALRTGLDMSVGHYQLELDNMTKGPKAQAAKGTDIESSVSVAGTRLPPMNRDQRLNVMQSALTTFDMMKCVLGRLCELIDLKSKG